MANLGTITWKVEVDTSDLKRADASMDKAKVSSDALGKSAKTTGTKIDKAGREAKTATEKMERGFKKTRTAASLAATAIKTVSAALVIRQVVAYTDAWNNASNQLRQVTNTTAELEQSQRDLLEIANETRAGFASTATLFARLKRSTGELALSDERLLAVTKTITQSFATSGATAVEAAGAITQLTQGLAAGALRGQEFNAVLEQAPGITRALRNSLGLTQGELRAFGMEGRITAEIVVTALEEAAESIDKDFNKTVKTFSQNMQIANNSLLEFAGNSGEVQAAVSLAGGSIALLAENIDNIIALSEILIAIYGVRLVSSLLKATKATIAKTVADRASAVAAQIATAQEIKLTAATNALATADLNAARSASARVPGFALNTSAMRALAAAESQAALAANAHTLAMAKSIPAVTGFTKGTTALKGVLALVGGPIGAVTVLVVGLALAYDRVKKAQEEARKGAIEWISGTGGLKNLDLAILGTINELTELNERMEQTRMNALMNSAAANVLIQMEHKQKDLVELLNDLAAERIRLEAEQTAATEAQTKAEEEQNTVTSVLLGNTDRYRGSVEKLTEQMLPLNLATMNQNVQLLDMSAVMTSLQTGTVPGYAETLKDATFRMEGVEIATKQTTIEMKLHQNMIEEVQRSWSNLIFDVLDEGKFRFRDFFDSILDGYKRLVAGILAENLAGIIFGGKGLGSIFSGLGSIVPGGGAAGGVAGSIAGGAASVAGQFIGGAAGTAVGAGSAIVGPPTAAAAAGAGLSGSLGAIGSNIAAFATNPITLGVLAAGALAKVLDPAGTMSHNAGFLLSSVGAGDREFSVDPFASGFAPIGFNRRSTMAEAIGVIDTFRALDAGLTQAALAAGITPSLSATSFGGFSEKGTGSGLFFGSASEDDGGRGTPIGQQMDRYAQQWVTAVGAQSGIDPTLIAQVIGDSTAAGILARAQGIAGIDGSFAGGLDRVPRDGFIAELHQGERVLTADEAMAADASGLGAGVSISENSSFFSLMNFMALNIDNMNDILDQWNGQNFVPVKEQA